MKGEIHYNPFLKLTILKSQGEGTCGQMGEISGYHGMVTCPECRKAIEQEKAGEHEIER